MVSTALLAMLFTADCREIIHVADWHWVSGTAFVADGEDQNDYAAFLDKVDSVQREQMAALKAMNAKVVWIEGNSDQTIADYRLHIETLKKVKLPNGDSVVDQFIRDSYREDVLQIGDAGRLLIAGEIDDVLPLEDHEAWRAANPLASGKAEICEAANTRREQAIVKRLLSHERAVIVLGAAHDLRKHLPAAIKYRVGKVKALP